MQKIETLSIKRNEITTEQNQDLPPLEKEGSKLRSSLIAIAKASHHKTFMETCLARNQPPKNMRAWVEPHIYRTNPQLEQEWRDTLHGVSLHLVSILIRHFGLIIKHETTEMRSLEDQVAQEIKQSPSLKTTWEQICTEVTETAKKLSDDLKQSREKKL